MPPDATVNDVKALDAITAAVRQLAATDDPISFDKERKILMAAHGLSASAVDAAVKRERERNDAVSASPHLDHDAKWAEIDRLSKLDSLAYVQERDAAAERIGIPASDLTRLVNQKRGNNDAAQGRAIELPDPEPWDKPVDGAELLSEITMQVRRYIILADGAAESVALWVVHAHALDTFGISPRLAITSPRPGCGKTTLLDVLYHLVPRPLLMANISPAAVFRTVELARPTLLADEADTWLQGNDELRGILNSGHRRGGSVIRVVGDDLEPRQFSTWGACAIAMIGRLPGTLADRSIAVALQRKRQDEVVAQFRYDRTEALDTLARKAARWAKDNTARLAGIDPAMPLSLHNRAADNWRPLLAIADSASGDWPRLAREIAEATVDAEQSKRAGLLVDIRGIFASKGVEQIASAELVEELVAIEGGDWAEYRNGKPITKNQLAKLLARDGVSPGTIRTKNGTPKGYKLAQFGDAFARYLADPLNRNATTPQGAEKLAFPGNFDPRQGNGCGVSEYAEKPQFSAGCGVVADRKPLAPSNCELGDPLNWETGL